MPELSDITKGPSQFPVGLLRPPTLTHALRGLVAIAPLPCLQALGTGLLPGLQLEALVAMVHGLRSHRVLLAEDDTITGGSGNSTGESWGRRRRKNTAKKSVSFQFYHGFVRSELKAQIPSFPGYGSSPVQER